MVKKDPQHPAEPPLVAPRLRALRETLGMSKTEFAARIDIDQSSYVKIEKGDKPLLPHTAYRIYERWAVDMNYIYLGRFDGLPANLSKQVMDHLSARVE